MPTRRFLTFLFLLASLMPLAGVAAPTVVQESFAQKYPGIEVKKWGLDSNGRWEAKFEVEGFKYRADFNKNGEWVETERSLRFKELPEKVQEAVKREYGDERIAEVEEVNHPTKGLFYDVEFKRSGKNQDVEFDPSGRVLIPAAGFFTPFQATMGDFTGVSRNVEDMSLGELLLEFALNLVIILIFARFIYYRRHHDHQMLFLLLGFNLFLFPIFLLSSSLSAGFGFTIFAVLALVRLRSDTFSKTEVTYLVGAVALTFINALLPAKVEIVSSIIVLLTAWFGDHPSIWANAFHGTEIRYRLKDMSKALDNEYLKAGIEKDFGVQVNYVDIQRVVNGEVRLRVAYRDRRDVTRGRKNRSGKPQEV